MQLKTNSCVAIIGRRGSGKSVWVKNVIWDNLQSIVCHDRKHEFNFEGIPIAHTVDELQAFWDQGHTKITYQPWSAEFEDFDDFCKAIFDRGNTGVWIDETASCTTANITPKWFGECMRLGRIRGIGCYCASQRPMQVSNLVFSEAELVVSFKLNLYNDALKVAQIAGERVVNTVMALEPYHFIVSDGNEIQVCSPLIINEGQQEQEQEEEIVENENGEIQSEQNAENQLEE